MKYLERAFAIALGLAIAVGASPMIARAQPEVAQATLGHAEGEVRKVDKEAGKLTVRHGPIEGLDMPGMTMVFRMQDRAALDTLKVGDKIRIDVEKVSGTLTIIRARKLN